MKYYLEAVKKIWMVSMGRIQIEILKLIEYSTLQQSSLFIIKQLYGVSF